MKTDEQIFDQIEKEAKINIIKTFMQTEGFLLGILIVIAVTLVTLVVLRKEHEKKVNPIPCSRYADLSVADIPVRCFEYYHLTVTIHYK